MLSSAPRLFAPGGKGNLILSEVKDAAVGDGAVDDAVCQGTLFLEPVDEIPHLLPGDILRKLVENMLQVVKIGTDVSGVAFQGMAGKASQGNHFLVSFKISVHNGIFFV